MYFVSGDKKQAWKVEITEGTYAPIEMENVPKAEQIRGYPDEFFPTTDKDNRDSFVQVIRQRELLNEKDYEDYLYLGTYDKFLSYVHEVFIFMDRSVIVGMEQR
ncbi:hypothetical protein P0082_09245 [Candidatus Haliotispira prima]|uniref:Uncharacterized protein n=1 Tax=Candidatus Haliotispira prima TaxID=3034016 RepID=A0ABY8MFA0_9SPIO|nr:hypothetical protein P0082_09245 [Candidatus Haliotispira prima]